MANHGHHTHALCFHRFSFSFLLWSFFPTGGDSFLFFVGGFFLLQLFCDSSCLPKFCGSNFHRKPPWLQTSKSLLSSSSFPLFAHWVLLPLPVKAMAETLRQSVQDLSLGTDDDYIVLPPKFCPRVASVTRFSSVVIPVNTRKQNLRALIGQMPRVWGLTGSCIGRLIGNGRVQFNFQIEESMNLVLQQGFWSFNDWMLSVHRWYPNIGDDDMKIISFWVQIQVRVLAADEDIIKLVETKKNSQAQRVTSGDPVTLFVFGEDENYDSFHKSWKDKKDMVMIAEIYDRLLVVATNKCWWDRIGRQQKSIFSRVMVTNEYSCIRCVKSHGLEPTQTTYHNFVLITVMRKAFRSFIYKMLAFYECMKRGLNRFILLPVRLLLESRVTSTSSSKLGFNFIYLFQWLYLNGFLYHVNFL